MGSGGVAIAALPTVICLKVSFSDGLGGGKVIADTLTNNNYQSLSLMSARTLARGFCIYS